MSNASLGKKIRRTLESLEDISREQLRCLVYQIEQRNSPLSSKEYGALLRQCSKAKALSEGRRVYTCITTYGMYSETFLGNLVVQMFGKCGKLEEARGAFQVIAEKNVFSWNIMISAYAQNGNLGDAIDIFHSMPVRDVIAWNATIAAYAQNGYASKAFQQFCFMDLDGMMPNRATFASVLNICSTPEQGRLIHAIIKESKWLSEIAIETVLFSMYARLGCLENAINIFQIMREHDVVSWTAMLTAYAQNGQVEDARKFFEDMPLRNTISWNTIISAYTQKGEREEAIALFMRMDVEGYKPDAYSFSYVLEACAETKSETFGKLIHASLVDEGIELDATLITTLVGMYGKFGMLEESVSIFKSVSTPDEILISTMITVYALNGDIEAGKNMFDRMRKPNLVGWNSMLTLYAQAGNLTEAESMFSTMPSKDVVSWTVMIGAYAQNGRSDAGLYLFRKMDLQGYCPSDATFVTVLDLCSKLDCLTEGKMLHAEIVASGFDSETKVQNALVNMYGKCGDPEEAWGIFRRISQRNFISWTGMLTTFAQNGYGAEALDLFRTMDIEGVEIDRVAYVSVFDACATVSAWGEAKVLLSFIDKSPSLLDPYLATSMLNMYSKCGMFTEARSLFDNMPRRDLVTWTAMISAYGQNGHPKEAVQVFHLTVLDGQTLNEVVFVSLLSACSQGGFLANGLSYLAYMKQDYGIEAGVEHYICMVDLLGRMGRLIEAEDLLQNMPYEPSMVVWMTFLAACKLHGDVNYGIVAAEQSTKFDPDDGTQYVLLASIHRSHALDE